jgi:aldose 1-epimerase
MLVLPKKHRPRSCRSGSRTLTGLALLALPFSMLEAQNYSATPASVDGVDVIRLADKSAGIEVVVVPSSGNNIYSMTVKGQPVFWSPYKAVSEMKSKPVFAGNPFLSPWANRLDRDGFWANGHNYTLNPDLKNFRRDPNRHPIHGLVSYTGEWIVAGKGADEKSAWVTSRLDFWRNPGWMAQFPFAHAVTTTYRLAGGALEVHTLYENQANEPMPLVIGYHPYFTLPGVPRDDWRVHLGAKDHVTLSPALVPTGERTPVSSTEFGLRGTTQDDVYTNLVRGADGRAEFSVEGGSKKISVIYGPQYTVAVVYAPPGKDFICFEPMTGVTNASNLAHDGKYAELQSVPANGRWEESFWIRPSGY